MNEPSKLELPSNYKNLEGLKIEDIEVLYYVGLSNKNNSRWYCKCSCGNKFITTSSTLLNGSITCCKECKIKHSPKTYICEGECKQEKPFTEEFFYKSKNKEYSLLTVCKNCHRTKTNIYGRIRDLGYKLKVMLHYSNNTLACACCGIKDKLEFLSIDHINGEGNKERKELKRLGKRQYHYLIENNYPEGYRVLCHSCNMSYGFFGYCPCKEPEKSKELLNKAYESLKQLEKYNKHLKLETKEEKMEEILEVADNYILTEDDPPPAFLSKNSRFDNLTNQEIGKLKILYYLGTKEYNNKMHSFWYCQCKCGNKLEIVAYSLKNGNTRSCGKCPIERPKVKICKGPCNLELPNTNKYFAWKDRKTGLLRAECKDCYKIMYNNKYKNR